MFIETESTPNPATLKFLPGQPVLGSGTADFRDAHSAEASPLAGRLFNVDGVHSVFLGGDFVTVTKSDGESWDSLKPFVLAAIQDHFTSGDPVMAEGAESAAGPETDDETSNQIRELIETKVRPAVAQDGGDITFHAFRDGIVYLHMKGSCAGCPSATATLKNGIENLLTYYVPEVRGVEAVN